MLRHGRRRWWSFPQFLAPSTQKENSIPKCDQGIKRYEKDEKSERQEEKKKEKEN